MESVVRMGGDEFMVVLTCPEPGRLAALEQWYTQQVGRSPTPFSLGATHHAPGESVADPLQRADSRLYRERARVRTHPRPAT